MARKFLYVIAALIVLVFAVMFALRLWSEQLTELVFVPRTEFEQLPPLAENAYSRSTMWFSRPDAPGEGLVRWAPHQEAQAAGGLPAVVFFIHPTSYLAKAHWNAPLDDAESRERAELFIRAMASPFGRARQIWAPRYRQAAFGAFLTDAPQAAAALDTAFADVLAAFDVFIAEAPADAPIILAGHSQGAFHLKRLLNERFAGTPLAGRVAAAYAVGWPISREHDLPAVGLPACEKPDQAGCIASWLSFAEPADTATVLKGYAHRLALDGKSPVGSAFLCTNPLTGSEGGEAPASTNLGTLVPDADLHDGKMATGLAGARCGKDGFLYIGEGPDLGPYVLPGNNYHVYDIPLFWRNLQADAARRAAAWEAGKTGAKTGRQTP
ncbi:MAG: DUF3089 domain-containing protein, partial [Novosphingobium sp.]